MKRKPNPPPLLLGILAIFFLLGGCGSTSMTVTLGYDVQTTSTLAILKAETLRLYVDTFSDVRGVDERTVGEAKTGAFNVSAPILIEDSVADLLTRAFSKALSKAGFNLVRDEESADLVFKGRINAFWVQEFTTGWSPEHTEAEVEFELLLTDKVRGRNLWFDVKRTRVRSESTFTDITYMNRDILNEAFNKTVASVLNDDELAAAMRAFARLKQ